jgi:uncharacterized membrane protein YoaK (UPF0700 family)
MAIALSALAGYVDAQGYLSTGALFVAFMSGNSTILGISAMAGSGGRTELALGLVAAFVAGVMLGTWVGRPFGAKRAPVILLLMAALLAGSAWLGRQSEAITAALVIALAMGTENTVFQRDGVSGLGLTYMTGTLVRLGQKLAEAIAGRSWSAAMPDLLLWFGMVGGAGVGAATYQRIGLEGLWVSAGLAVILAGAAWLGVRRAPMAQA